MTSKEILFQVIHMTILIDFPVISGAKNHVIANLEFQLEIVEEVGNIIH